MIDFFKLLRPHHWSKNGLVFAGVFFGHAWNNQALLTKAILLFLGFSLVASGVYIINDVLDRHADRAHPKKCLRPIARGAVDPRIAVLIAHILFASGLVLAVSTGSMVAFFLVLGYLAMNLAYSKWLKHFTIIDVAVLSSSYMLRILAGTIGIGIHISQWLLLCGLSVTLLLGFGKRLAEKHMLESAIQRKSVQTYDESFLVMALSIMAAVFLVFYGLYSLSPETINTHGRSLILSYPWVIIGVLRYMQLVMAKNPLTEDPATMLIRDKALGALSLGWAITIYWILMSSNDR